MLDIANTRKSVTINMSQRCVTQSVTEKHVKNVTLSSADMGLDVQGVFFDWSPLKSLSIEILYENT